MFTCVAGAAVQAVWEPVLPLNAIAGMPSLEASVAAPTVPEIRVVLPRLATRMRLARTVATPLENNIRMDLPPTLNPATAIFGAPPKNFGASVWIP